MVKTTTDINYDYKTHKYFLNNSYLQDIYGFSVGDCLKLDDTNDVEKALKRGSRVIYSFVYMYCPDLEEREKLEYLIANSEELRDAICAAMGEYFYSLYNEEFDNSYRTGIYGKKEISMNELKEASVSLEIQRLLNNAGLLFRGHRACLDIDKIREAKNKGEF
nr:MAG TPA: hypothetical protein [Caudoviricetes sp.]